jgi:hypothetical protein
MTDEKLDLFVLDNAIADIGDAAALVFALGYIDKDADGVDFQRVLRWIGREMDNLHTLIEKQTSLMMAERREAS